MRGDRCRPLILRGSPGDPADPVGTPVAFAPGMGAAMIPIVLVICTVLLGVIAGWQPFPGFVGLVVLALFAFIVAGLIGLIDRLEHPESPDR